MIQRIQSVYLSLTTLLTLFLLKGDYLSFIEDSGSAINITFMGISRKTEAQGMDMIEKLFPFSVVIILILAISIIAIFLFKNRKIQMRFVLGLIILIVGLILISFYYASIISVEYNAMIVPKIKMTIPGLILVFSVLAYRRIRKDELLVKSYDRLR
jgi:Domain of unknown function (DUF4293)